MTTTHPMPTPALHPTETPMHQYEASTPGALQIPAYLPGAHVQGYEDRAYAARRPYVSRHEHDATVARLTAELAAAHAEIARMEWGLCHLMWRDGARHDSRVAVPLLALLVTDGAV